ncbi:phage late control D family protein [Vibrio mimicus]
MGKLNASGVISAYAIVNWAGKSVSQALSRYVASLSYTDVLDSNKVGTDSVSLTLSNHDGRFFDAWYPESGDSLECGIGWQDSGGNRHSWMWGKFTIDEVKFQIGPDRVLIEANAKPAVRGSIDNEESVVYEDTSFVGLAERIAEEAGIQTLIADDLQDVPYMRIQQRDESKSAMLSRIAKDNGIPVAFKGSKLVVGQINSSTIDIDIVNRDVVIGALLPISKRSQYDGVRVMYFDQLSNHGGEFEVGTMSNGAKVKYLYPPEVTTAEEAKRYAENYMATGSGDGTKQAATGRLTLVNTTVTTADVINLINAGKLPTKWKPTTVSTSLTAKGWSSTVSITRQS